MRAWLLENACTEVVMESTGSYWRPVFNILEGDLQVILANPEQVKALRGKKTDRKDCRWLAGLLRHGLVQASFIPPRDIRELRDLTRRRRKLLENGTEERNRVAKVLEDANVKIGNVLADVFGMSGQAMRQIELACTVPGIARDAAASILAEIGIDMSDRGPFATCHHLASWAGVCPGNNSSGGKRKSGNIRKGNRWLKATLSQTAWAGAAKKNSTFQFRYHRLKSRRGGKRAAIAVAHAQIIALYWVLRNGVPYQQQIRELQQQQQ
jgi:transposase